MNSCLISVIIVNYNAGKTLSQCVRSIADCKLNMEILIVDNNSSDSSISDLLFEFGDNSMIQVIKNCENLGFAKACNAGASVAKGDFLLYLNPDCMVNEQAVLKLLACVTTDQRIGMAGGRILNGDGTEQSGSRRLIPTPWRALMRVCRCSLLARLLPQYFADFNLNQHPVPEYPIEVEAISGACMLVPRKAYEEVGGLDEGFFLHCEDLDWCLSFREKNWKVMFVPDVEIYHFQGTCSRSRRAFVEWHKHKGMVRFYKKHFSHQYPGILLLCVTTLVWIRFALIFSSITWSKFQNWFSAFFVQGKSKVQSFRSTEVEVR